MCLRELFSSTESTEGNVSSRSTSPAPRSLLSSAPPELPYEGAEEAKGETAVAEGRSRGDWKAAKDSGSCRRLPNRGGCDEVAGAVNAPVAEADAEAA